MASFEVKTVGASLEKAKLFAAAFLLLASVLAFYLLARQAVTLRWGALLGGLLAGGVVFALSEAGKQLVLFVRDAWREVKKVVWPSRKESIQITLYVFVFVVVMALFLWLTDKTLEWVFYDLILDWKK